MFSFHDYCHILSQLFGRQELNANRAVQLSLVGACLQYACDAQVRVERVHQKRASIPGRRAVKKTDNIHPKRYPLQANISQE